MKLVSHKRMLLAGTIVVAALSCGQAAAQAVPLTSSSQQLAQAEPQKPGEERRKDQPPPPKGAQPQTQPQRPGTQGAQPQGPQRHDQRQETQQDRPPPGAQGQPPASSQQQERQERRQPPGAPQPGQPRTTQQPTQPPGGQPGGPGQPRTTQQPGQPGGTPPDRRRDTQQERRQQTPGTQQPGTTPPTPRTTQQPGQAPGQPPGAQPGPAQPQTTQQPGPGPAGPSRPQTTQQPPGQPPGRGPGGPAQPQTTQQPPGQQPGGQRDQRRETLRPPPPGTPAPSQNVQPLQPQPGAPGRPGAATVDTHQQQQQFETMRQQRQERVENNGQRTVIVEPDRRMIVRENGRVFVRHDEVERFRVIGGDVRVERRSGETVTVLRRPGDVEIVTYLDDNGRLLRRVRRTRDGREFVLIDNRFRGPERGEIFVSLPPPRIVMPREEYIVEMEYAPRERIFAALEAPPIERIERPYTLDEIRFSPALRDRMRRVDLDTITFEFGSWQVLPDQVQLLANIAEAINAVVGRNPDEVFLIEGHTDAVGSDVDNLSLSDRRAESVAVILSQNFQVPPENLTTQGYGAQQLKVQTPGPSRENRRVTVRRITPLLTGSSQ